MTKNNNTFLKITNRDIFDEIKGLKKTVFELKETSEKSLKDLDGRVKLNRWIAGTALVLALMAIGWFLTVMSHG